MSRDCTTHALGLTTGGRRSTDCALILHLRHQLPDALRYFDTGGPLDAPCVMHAGSVNSVDWTDGRGNALALPTEIHR